MKATSSVYRNVFLCAFTKIWIQMIKGSVNEVWQEFN